MARVRNDGHGISGSMRSSAARARRFWTVLSDRRARRGDRLAPGPHGGGATALLTEDLTARQRAAITAVCTDMHRPYLNAVGAVLPKAEIVFDKFHVLQHASAALDDVRRQEFFRAGAGDAGARTRQALALLRRWKTVRGSKRGELQTLFAANRRLFKAYVLREQLDRLWTYKTRAGRPQFSAGLDSSAAMATTARDGAAGRLPLNISRASPPTAIILSASVSSNRSTRRSKPCSDARAGCGMNEMLLLKLKWATAHPIRSARDLARFLNVQRLYSNR